MLKSIIISIGIVLMIIGAATLAFMLSLKLISPRRRRRYVVIIPLTQKDDSAALISSAIEKRSILNEREYCDILAVDCGIQPERLQMLMNMYKGLDMLTICQPEEAMQLVHKSLYCDL